MERYSKSEHFERLKETTKIVRRRLIDKLDTGESDFLKSEPVWAERVLSDSTLFLRPLIVRNVYEACGGDIQDANIDMLASVEALNISTYQTDFIFDSSSLDRADLGRQIVSSYDTTFRGISFILNHSESPKKNSKIADIFIEKMNEVYRGQWLDTRVFPYKHEGKSLLNMEREKYLSVYRKRCGYLDGSQFGLCFVLGYLMKESSPKVGTKLYENLFKIGFHFGVCIQALNDMESLVSDDQSDDLKFGIVTYPIYLSLNRNQGLREKFAEHWNSREPEPRLKNFSDKIKSKKTTRPLVKFLLKEFKKIRDKINIVSKNTNVETRFFDFIFPHIFFSRIMSDYNISKEFLFEQKWW
jgi:geranylgeranyl pyrophosphate synthase